MADDALEVGVAVEDVRTVAEVVAVLVVALTKL